MGKLQVAHTKIRISATLKALIFCIHPEVVVNEEKL